MEFTPGVYGVLLQYPDERGAMEDLTTFISRAHEKSVLVAVATDLLALALFKPPGEMGADVVVGNSQRFGVPLGYGGPHAAFFATRNAYVRQMPGRLIGVSVDAHGHTAYRMALATREQHIRREKATSNICTAQALLANMAAMYAVYHGPAGLKAIAAHVHSLSQLLATFLESKFAIRQQNARFFDTLCFEVPDGVARLKQSALSRGINFRYIDDSTVGISLNETSTAEDLADIELPRGCFALPVYRDGRSPESPPARLLFEGTKSGSGRTADWDEARALASRTELILAGGLDTANVADAIRRVQPWGVDVSSGVEKRRGEKDPQMIHEFIARVRAIDGTHPGVRKEEKR